MTTSWKDKRNWPSKASRRTLKARRRSWNSDLRANAQPGNTAFIIFPKPRKAIGPSGGPLVEKRRDADTVVPPSTVASERQSRAGVPANSKNIYNSAACRPTATSEPEHNGLPMPRCLIAEGCPSGLSDGAQ